MGVTANVTITEADGWTLIVPSASTNFAIISIVSQGVVEVATTTSDSTAPTVAAGHPFKYGDHVTRLAFPINSIWMRVAPGWMYGKGSVLLAVNYA